MNGDGENVVAQERRIWQSFDRRTYLVICLVDPRNRHFTISEVRHFLERRHVQNGTTHPIVERLYIERSSANSPHPTKQECIVLGRSCQPLAHHLQKLGIDGWTDSETSCILRHISLPTSTIDWFYMVGTHEEIPLTTRTLSDELPASLQALELNRVVLTSVDCQLLGQMISNKERALNCLQLIRCSFPCLADFLTLIAGFVKDKIPSNRCQFLSCTVKDSSVPNYDEADYLEFVRIFGVFWKRRHGQPEKPVPQHRPTRFDNAAHELLNYFRPMQQAGLSRLLLLPSQHSDNVCDIETRQPRERWEWVKLLGHEAVIDRVDLLFHIMLLNPEVCVLERDCSVVASLKATMVDNGNGDELHETKSPSRKRRKPASK